jgi:3-oxoacyl-[acyl-carrier-protein] synthase-3
MLKFNNASIAGIVTMVGDKRVSFMDSYKDYALTEKEALRIAKIIGLDTRYIVTGSETTSDLCYFSAKKLLSELSVEAKKLDGLIFVSQTPDFSSPATAISLQNRLGMKKNSMCFDIRLGCSGFVYGLSTAFSYIDAGLEAVLLCVGDVASKIVKSNDHTVAPLMGDAGSAILIRRRPSESFFTLNSDGSGYDALIIPNSGIRHEKRFSESPSYLQMNGAEVFNFTIKEVPKMVENTLSFSGKMPDEIDFFVLHQPNQYILKNIINRMEISPGKIPHKTQSVYGNQNSASIPGTINGFLSNDYSNREITSFFGGFGVGLSWGAAVLVTDRIYCPKAIILGEFVDIS